VNASDFADEFVAHRAPEIVIAAQDFHIGIADARHAHANECPARFPIRQRLSSGDKFAIAGEEA
jgi:hypothetical protein